MVHRASLDAPYALRAVIGHMKEGHRLGRNFLAGRDGDRFNGKMAAAGFNFRRLLKWFEALLRFL